MNDEIGWPPLDYEQLTQAFSVALYVADPKDGAFQWVSPALETLIGYSADELVADSAARAARIHPSDRYEVLHELAEAVVNRQRFSAQYRMLARDGHVVWVDDWAVPVYGETDTVTAVHGLLIDSTTRKRVEEELGDRERQQAALLSLSQRALSSGDVTALLDDVSGIVATTLEVDCCAVLECARDGRALMVRGAIGWLEGDNGLEVPLDEGLFPSATLLTNQPITVQDLQKDSRFRLPDSFEGFGAVSGAAVPILASPRPWGVVAAQTTSPRTFAQRDVRFLQSVANLLSAAMAQRNAQEELQQAGKMEALGRLAGGIAHDFNNVLTAIMGFAERLGPSLRDESAARGDLSQLLAAADRARSLVEQLLLFSRTPVAAPAQSELNEVAASMLEMLRRLMGSTIELSWRPDPAAGRVPLDRNRLEQVVLNLCVNARDAMPAGGRITIRTAARHLEHEHRGVRPGVYAVLAVVDEGEGMDDATVRQVFEPFFTTKEDGTGLGLATLWGIIESAGGQVLIDTEPGAGTTMAVHLPQVDAADGAEAANDPVAPPAPQGRSEDGAATGSILVVEDQEAILSLVSAILEQEGHTVIAASHGPEALALAGEQPVDVVLTDISMPEMRGPELVERLRELWPAVRVVFMSGGAEPDIDGWKAQGRADAFLQKPFGSQELRDTVRRALG